MLYNVPLVSYVQQCQSVITKYKNIYTCVCVCVCVYIQAHPLCLHLYCFPKSRFISTIFLNSVFMYLYIYIFFSLLLHCI